MVKKGGKSGSEGRVYGSCVKFMLRWGVFVRGLRDGGIRVFRGLFRGVYVGSRLGGIRVKRGV